MDQGAIIAIKIAQTPNRFLSGIIEKQCKKIVKDRTNFRLMLTKKNNLIKIKKLIIKNKIKIINKLLINYKKYILNNNKIYIFNYPIIQYPKKKYIKNIILNKYKIIKNKLKGIKGQYLIFDNNLILNIRNHIGNIININII